MSLYIKLPVACAAALVALVVYAVTGAKVAYYAGWLPTAGIALYYLTLAGLTAVCDDEIDGVGL